MEKLGGRFGRGRGVASVDGEVACEATLSFIIPGEGVLAMTRGRRPVRRPRQRRRARGGPQGDPRARSRTLVAIAGDLVLNGPDPAAAVDAAPRAWRPTARSSSSGNTDIAVADFDYAAAFPWMTDGVPDAFRAAAEWAHDALGDERVAWLRRLPSERRLRVEDGTMILVCHASPGSQTAGFDQDLDPTRHHRARLAHGRPGHRLRPHPPPRGPRPRLEADRQRRLGGLRLRRRPDGVVGAASTSTASDVRAEIRRTEFDVAGGGQRDLRPRPAGRRLPRGHGPHREAGPMTGRRRRRRRVVVTGMGAGHGRSATTSPSTWAGLVAGRSGIRTIEAFDPSRLDVAGSPARCATSTPAASSTARRSGGPTATSSSGSSPRAEALDQAGLPERLEGELAERTGRDPRHRARRRRARSSTGSRPTRCAGRTGSARSSSRWASRTSAPARSPSASA